MGLLRRTLHDISKRTEQHRTLSPGQEARFRCLGDAFRVNFAPTQSLSNMRSRGRRRPPPLQRFAPSYLTVVHVRGGERMP